MQKCFNLLKDLESQEKISNEDSSSILVWGAIGGRFDHSIGTLHAVMVSAPEYRKVYLIQDGNLLFLLRKGTHTIECDKNQIGPSCGLIPVGVDVPRVSTKGLKWNLQDQETSIGGLLSVCNVIPYADDHHTSTVEVTVHSGCIFWTCELHLQ